MIWNDQDGFTRHKSCTSHLIALCPKMTTSVAKKAPAMLFIYFSQAFDAGALGTGKESAVNPGIKVSSRAVSAGALPGAQGRTYCLCTAEARHIWMLWPA